MSTPLEHDYIGFSGPNNGLLKTDLSLGLPGRECDSSQAKALFGVTLFGKDLEEKPQNGVLNSITKTCASGAKRGFSDAIDTSDKWVLSINGRSKNSLNKDDKGSCSSSKPVQDKKHEIAPTDNVTAPAAKAQVVGWPPIGCFRKNNMASNSTKNTCDTEEKSISECLYVKVSMDGAPYKRKVDLQNYKNYKELSLALEKMFSCFITGRYGSRGHVSGDGKGECHSTDRIHSSEYVLTYEDKDGDWMLVGDVPWKMFTENCSKLRIMKGAESIGLGPSCG